MIPSPRGSAPSGEDALVHLPFIYLDGELPVREAGLVEGHLQACPTCPPLYASLVGAHAVIVRPPTTFDAELVVGG